MSRLPLNGSPKCRSDGHYSTASQCALLYCRADVAEEGPTVEMTLGKRSLGFAYANTLKRCFTTLRWETRGRPWDSLLQLGQTGGQHLPG